VEGDTVVVGALGVVGVVVVVVVVVVLVVVVDRVFTRHPHQFDVSIAANTAVGAAILPHYISMAVDLALRLTFHPVFSQF